MVRSAVLRMLVSLISVVMGRITFKTLFGFKLVDLRAELVKATRTSVVSSRAFVSMACFVRPHSLLNLEVTFVTVSFYMSIIKLQFSQCTWSPCDGLVKEIDFSLFSLYSLLEPLVDRTLRCESSFDCFILFLPLLHPPLD